MRPAAVWAFWPRRDRRLLGAGREERDEVEERVGGERDPVERGRLWDPGGHRGTRPPRRRAARAALPRSWAFSGHSRRRRARRRRASTAATSRAFPEGRRRSPGRAWACAVSRSSVAGDPRQTRPDRPRGPAGLERRADRLEAFRPRPRPRGSPPFAGLGDALVPALDRRSQVGEDASSSSTVSTSRERIDAAAGWATCRRERAHDVDHGIGRADLAQELVPKPLAVGGAARRGRRCRRPGGSRDDLRRGREPGELRPGAGRGVGLGVVRLDGREHVRRHCGARPGECVEDGGLAAVWEADESRFEARHHTAPRPRPSRSRAPRRQRRHPACARRRRRGSRP